jgi:hypothetical protein
MLRHLATLLTVLFHVAITALAAVVMTLFFARR